MILRGRLGGDFGGLKSNKQLEMVAFLNLYNSSTFDILRL
jgi:hypothetical protein